MGKFNENSKLKEILKDERAKDIIEKYLPGMMKGPGMKIALLMNPSIKQAKPYRKQINMSDETMNNFLGEIYALD